ncbi:hypothetical protein DRE_01219 [Drechslerella stenobrocha 248]|uniref:Uncharacterized protein n=1 Tax=Drechslerella stenobrocha 248 TaxID=1043628 RepID=W7HWR9_9PEZI|nr:hypothetical protein DRE_01219 [Drechslerella stenobrocha 248]
MGGCHCRRRQQRGLVTSAILTGLNEYQNRKADREPRALPSSSRASSSMPSAFFQEPMVQGTTYAHASSRQVHPVDPNPPPYEDVLEAAAPEKSAPPPPHTVDTRHYSYDTDIAGRVPPHEHQDYQPNANQDYIPRFVPASPLTPVPSSTSRFSHEPPSEALARLLKAITSYYDARINLAGTDSSKRHRLEVKKAKKLAKAEKKHVEHLAKGKESKYNYKMARRAAKMEMSADWVTERSHTLNEHANTR